MVFFPNQGRHPTRHYHPFPIRFIQRKREKFTQNNAPKVGISENITYLCPRYGGLAQLARALAWHARGHRFEPGILHHRRLFQCETACFYIGVRKI